MPPAVFAPSSGTRGISPKAAGFHRILLAIDFEPTGDRALRRTARLPLRPNATIVLTHVLPSTVGVSASSLVAGVAEQELDQAETKLAALLGRRGRRDVSLRTRLVKGDAATEIARLAQHNAAELVVVGRGGSRLSGTMLGSTAQRVARLAQMPVLLVRRNPTVTYRRIVVGIDLSEDAIRAARLTTRISKAFQARVTAVHAFQDPRSDLAPTLFKAVAKARWRAFAPLLAAQARRARQLLAKAGAPRQWALSFKGGDPRQRLLEVAASKRADLLVVGSRSRRGLPRLVLGSVAEAVLTQATCDVLISPRRRWDA